MQLSLHNAEPREFLTRYLRRAAEARKLLSSRADLEGFFEKYFLKFGILFTAARLLPDKQLCLTAFGPADMYVTEHDTVSFGTVSQAQPADDHQRGYFGVPLGLPLHYIPEGGESEEDRVARRSWPLPVRPMITSSLSRPRTALIMSAVLAAASRALGQHAGAGGGLPAALQEYKLHVGEVAGLYAALLALLANGIPGEAKRPTIPTIIKRICDEQRPLVVTALPFVAETVCTCRPRSPGPPSSSLSLDQVEAIFAGGSGAAFKTLSRCPEAAWGAVFAPTALKQFKLRTLPNLATLDDVLAALSPKVFSQRQLIEVGEYLRPRLAGTLEEAPRTSATRESDREPATSSAAAERDPRPAQGAKKPVSTPAGATSKPAAPPSKASKAPKKTGAAKAPAAPAVPKKRPPPPPPTDSDDEEEDVEVAPKRPRPAPTPFSAFDKGYAGWAPNGKRPIAPNAAAPAQAPAASRPGSFFAAPGGARNGNAGSVPSGETWNAAPWSAMGHAGDLELEDADDFLEEVDPHAPLYYSNPPNGQPPYPATFAAAPQPPFSSSAPAASRAPLPPAAAKAAIILPPVEETVRSQHGLPINDVNSAQMREAVVWLAKRIQKAAQTLSDGRVGEELAPNAVAAAAAKGGAAVGAELADSALRAVLLHLEQAFASRDFAGLLAAVQVQSAVLDHARAAGDPELVAFLAQHFVKLERACASLEKATRSAVAIHALCAPSSAGGFDPVRLAASGELLLGKGTATNLLKEEEGFGLAGQPTWQQLEGAEAALKFAARTSRRRRPPLRRTWDRLHAHVPVPPAPPGYYYDPAQHRSGGGGGGGGRLRKARGGGGGGGAAAAAAAATAAEAEATPSTAAEAAATAAQAAPPAAPPVSRPAAI
eukprot:tig00000147_g9507.t1